MIVIVSLTLNEDRDGEPGARGGEEGDDGAEREPKKRKIPLFDKMPHSDSVHRSLVL